MTNRHHEPESLARAVSRARRAAGLTQQAAADRAGVSLGAVRDLEQGRTLAPRPGTVRAVLRAVGVRPVAAPAGSAAASQDALRVRGVTVRLLGPLEAFRSGAPVRLGSPGRAVLLGRLALTPGRVVPDEELFEVVFDGELPRDPAGAVRSHVCRLRAAVGAQAITRSSGGYRLALPPDRLDAAAFRRDVSAAAPAVALRPSRALDLLDRALRRWRGRPCADVGRLAEHPAAVTLLDDLAEVALRHADLAGRLGCWERAVAPLRTATALLPWHEPVHARLVTVLAAAQRRGEAAGVYDAVCRRLAGELGVGPGAELRAARERLAGAEPPPVVPSSRRPASG